MHKIIATLWYYVMAQYDETRSRGVSRVVWYIPRRPGEAAPPSPEEPSGAASFRAETRSRVLRRPHDAGERGRAGGRPARTTGAREEAPRGSGAHKLQCDAQGPPCPGALLVVDAVVEAELARHHGALLRTAGRADDLRRIAFSLCAASVFVSRDGLR